MITQRNKIGFVKKTRAIKLKIQEKHMISTYFLNSIWNENFARLLFYLELKHKTQLFAGRLRRNLKDGYMLHKKKPPPVK